MKKILVLAVAVLMAVSLAACSGNTNSPASGNDAPAGGNAPAAGTEASSGVVGEWAYSDEGTVNSSFLYTFNADMTGSYNIIGDFTYTDDGKTLVFTYTDSDIYTDPMDFDYRIEGDKLILIDDIGGETVYVKQ
jgi:predicted small secreted protein